MKIFSLCVFLFLSVLLFKLWCWIHLISGQLVDQRKFSYFKHLTNKKSSSWSWTAAIFISGSLENVEEIHCSHFSLQTVKNKQSTTVNCVQRATPSGHKQEWCEWSNEPADVPVIISHCWTGFFLQRDDEQRHMSSERWNLNQPRGPGRRTGHKRSSGSDPSRKLHHTTKPTFHSPPWAPSSSSQVPLV